MRFYVRLRINTGRRFRNMRMLNTPGPATSRENHMGILESLPLGVTGSPQHLPARPSVAAKQGRADASGLTGETRGHASWGQDRRREQELSHEPHGLELGSLVIQTVGYAGTWIL